jgi:Cys-tRNA(Pro) deacylase
LGTQDEVRSIHIQGTQDVEGDTQPKCWSRQASPSPSFGGRSAEMMKPADAERISGYKTGGISPFGQTRKTPAVLEEQALAHDLVYVNGGQRGLQVRLQVSDLVSALNAIVAPIVA